MKAFVFPGQGAQYIGMGQKLYGQYDLAKKMFNQANNILGFSITDVMFGSDEQALKQTKVTQPAVFLHSVILSKVLGNALKADFTITFHRKKIGHAIGFGKQLSGKIKVVDIGFSKKNLKSKCLENSPTLWKKYFPWKQK